MKGGNREMSRKGPSSSSKNFVTGSVLLVKCEDNLWRPVAFISKALNETERNYEIHNKEMLGVI